MTYTGSIAPISLTVTVVSGTGSLSIAAIYGNFVMVGAYPPSGTSTTKFDIELLDEDSLPIVVEPGTTGPTTYRQEFRLYKKFNSSNSHTLNITNATVDGSYLIKLYPKDA